jgi:hypothetical protein
MNPNKKQRTKDGRPPAAVTDTPLLVESVTPPPFRFHQPNESWVDGMDWEYMDHIMRLKCLTPQVIETGHEDRPETSFFSCLPKAVLEPLSAERRARMQTGRDSAIKVIKDYFKNYRAAQQDQENNQEKYEDESSDDYPSFDDGRITKTFVWNGRLTEDEAVEFVNVLPRHLMFTASFDADGIDERQVKHCYCPCSKKSQQWHKVAGQKVESGQPHEIRMQEELL